MGLFWVVVFTPFNPLAEVHVHRLKLPHWQQKGTTYFVRIATAYVIWRQVRLTLAVRFVLVTAVVMLEGAGSPLAAFTRSWRLTGGSHRRLCAFLALLLLPYMVISGLVTNMALLAGNLFFNALVSGLLSLAFTMLLTAIIVALHQQLSGAAQASAETFK